MPEDEREFTQPEAMERGEDPDREISPPDRPQGSGDEAVTAAEQRQGPGLDERIAREEQAREEPHAGLDPRDPGAGEGGRVEPGRLEDEGDGVRDEEGTLVADDADEDTSGRSAEEEAVRIEEGGVPGGTTGPDTYLTEP
jgi:hypothetical protein